MYSDDDTAEAVGFPIRKSMDQSLFAAPHGLSQRTTSFIACVRQGIHQMPFCHLIALIINAHPSGTEIDFEFSLFISMPDSRETDTDVKTRFSSRSTQQQAVQTLLTWVAASSTTTCVVAAGGSLRSIPSSRCKRLSAGGIAAREFQLLARACYATRSCVPAPRVPLRSRTNTAGGARRDRTDDLLLAKQALSQLSYGPVGRVGSGLTETRSQKVKNQRSISGF